MSGRAGPDEYDPSCDRHVARIPDGDISATLVAQIGETTPGLLPVAPHALLFTSEPVPHLP